MKNVSIYFFSLLALFLICIPRTSWAQHESEATNIAPTTLITRPVATYSIVARDPATGEMGVAVQSHWFSVGSIVTWAQAGVGAVATQSFVEPAYGPLGLELMRTGRTAEQALKALISSDENESVRQVGMIDVHGNVAAHTGSSAIRAAGHYVGENFSVQANMMENATVWPAMAQAFQNSKGDLADRMLAALDAAQAEGGDIRGKQSAAILIVPGVSTGKPWADKIFDLRIEDHPDPLGELRRLVRMQRAYNAMNAGDGYMTTGDVASAIESYNVAMDLLPDEATNGEAPFWVGVTLVSVDRVAEGIPYLKRAFVLDARWAELLQRLPETGLLPSDAALMKRLLDEMKK